MLFVRAMAARTIMATAAIAAEMVPSKINCCCYRPVSVGSIVEDAFSTSARAVATICFQHRLIRKGSLTVLGDIVECPFSGSLSVCRHFFGRGYSLYAA